jgi:hypothetical protein
LAEVSTVPGSVLGSALENILCADDIVPGSGPSYQLCKEIFISHPLGQKLTEAPIKFAQAFPREITIPDGPEDECKRAFEDQWSSDQVDTTICNVATQSRVYGIASVALLEKGIDVSAPLRIKQLADADIAFNVLDPLNTAGSLVLSQDPNSMEFQKHRDIRVSGKTYHRSRTVTIMNGPPIYISYTSAAYGFVGRSVYQRALFPLKSFVQTMRADDMVARKVGLIVATLKMAGNVIDKIMAVAAAFKRSILKVGMTDNVISIAQEEKIESLNLTNLEGPLREARVHILENIAAADDMPAKMLNNETFAEGFGEGTEDAKRIATYIEDKRKWMRPLYDFFDMVVQRRAWNEEFFKGIQRKFPEEYGNVTYEAAFYRWANSFQAIWPSLLREPESELVRVEETKFKTAVAAAQIFIPECDPVNKAIVLQFLADTINNSKKMFAIPLNLDYEALESHMQEEKNSADELKEPEPAAPFSARDSAETDPEIVGRIASMENFLRVHGRKIARIAR